MYCKKCGNLLKQGNLFCENCGERVIIENSISSQNTVAPTMTPTVAPTMTSTVQPNNPKKKNNWLFITIVVVLICTIVAIITAIVSTKTKNETSSDESNSDIVEKEDTIKRTESSNVANTATIYGLKFTIPDTLKFELVGDRIALTDKSNRYQFDFSILNQSYESIKTNDISFKNDIAKLGYKVLDKSVNTLGSREFILYYLEDDDAAEYVFYLTKYDSTNSYYGYIVYVKDESVVNYLFDDINKIINSLSNAGSFSVSDSNKDIIKFNNELVLNDNKKINFNMFK